jgi:hypothetical protein
MAEAAQASEDEAGAAGNRWWKLLLFVRRTKLLHILYWVLAWRSLVHTLVQHSPEPSLRVIQHSSTITILFQMGMVYTIVYGLLPRYFHKGHYFRFAVGALLAVLLFSVGAVYVKEAWMRAVIEPAYRLNHVMVVLSNVMDSIVIAFVFTVIYVAEHLFLKDRRSARLERQRLRSELDFLKAQLNPHFLFNTLNSLHVVMRHDAQRAERILMDFSGLLRYQLYECNGPATTLEKEMDFLRNYIALERMRHGDALEVRFDAPSPAPYFELAPFVLIPFVENAFKHVGRYARLASRIHIALRVEGRRLLLTVENTCEPDRSAGASRKGIGLENARRRLELLYPLRHELRIVAGEDLYRVHLMIEP